MDRSRRVKAMGRAAGGEGSHDPPRPRRPPTPRARRRVLDGNVVGTFLCCRAVVPGMMEARYGRTVNVASIAGKEGNPTVPPYSASKAAVIAMTKSLAKELVGKGDVTVNAIAPAV